MHRLQALAAVAAQHRPELQRAEAPAERRPVVARGVQRPRRRPQVLGHEAERLAEVVGPARPEQRAVHRHEQPLVRVDDERVGALDAVAATSAAPGRPMPSRRRRRRRAATRPRSRAVGDRRAPGRPTSTTSSRRSRRPRTRRRGRATSGRMRNSSSTGTLRSSSPSIRAAFSTDECACSEQTTTRASGCTCARPRARASVDVDAVSSMCPCQPSGQPEQLPRASRRRAARARSTPGEARQRIATWFSVAASSSARIAGSDAVIAKYAKKRGCCQCVIAGRISSSRSRSTSANGSPASGGDGRQLRRTARPARPARAPAARRRARGSAPPTRAPRAPSSRKRHRFSSARSASTGACSAPASFVSQARRACADADLDVGERLDAGAPSLVDGELHARLARGARVHVGAGRAGRAAS